MQVWKLLDWLSWKLNRWRFLYLRPPSNSKIYTLPHVRNVRVTPMWLAPTQPTALGDPQWEWHLGDSALTPIHIVECCVFLCSVQERVSRVRAHMAQVFVPWRVGSSFYWGRIDRTSRLWHLSKTCHLLYYEISLLNALLLGTFLPLAWLVELESYFVNSNALFRKWAFA